MAQRRADSRLANLRWLEADLAAHELPQASFDAVRTERVLMYLPDDCFERALDGLVRALRPGGRLALFELDYGATILAPGRAVAATPFSFAVDAPVWRRIAEGTLTADPPDPAISAWLRAQSAAVARGEFVAAFTGILTAAS